MNINRVLITGNLTSDPDLRMTSGGKSVCNLRIACGTRRKDQTSGEWVERPNYFDVVVWGTQAENAARFLSKGRAVAIDGRLQWREWETADAGKRQTVEIVADSVQFLGSAAALPSLAELPAPEPQAATQPQAAQEPQATPKPQAARDTAQEAPIAA
jgi:single-strand DNA-binding protein